MLQTSLFHDSSINITLAFNQAYTIIYWYSDTKLYFDLKTTESYK